MSSSTPKPATRQNVGTLIARYFTERGLDSPAYAPVSRCAGLDDQWVERVIKPPRNGRIPKVRRGTLLKVAAAMDLTPQEREDLERAAGEPPGSLRLTKAERLQPQADKISMRRAVLLLTAPTDPHELPFRSKRPRVATRSGVVFGWHDVVVRITTPEDESVLDYADHLFKSGKLRTIETIPLRDDLPVYVDQGFNPDGLHADDYYWAVIFVQALGTPKKGEFRDSFHDVALRPEFKGGIHLLTAAIAVGQFDTVVEILAANLTKLQDYVRDAQKLSNERGREVHTVTYFALRWIQRPLNGAF